MLLEMLAPVGTHKHECGCGTVWEHPNYRAGDRDAHCCPACHVVLPPPWRHYEGPDAPCYVEGQGLPMAA